ncbi:universal stress protein [Streptomyces axinellae]|uniref:Universal stress protein n=1 Tax=Streptomyces axinellae TaxID=552788 RepID=A0ABN3PL81_9ACTN
MREAVAVGADGSAESMEAVRWAASEAVSRGAALRVVTGAGRWAATATAADGGADSWPQENVRAAARVASDAWPQLEVREEVVGEGPVKVLLRAAEESEVLVIGSRALGAFTGFAVGSVGLSVIAHVRAPVVAVRSHDGAESGSAAPVVVGVDLGHSYDPVLGFAFEAAGRRGTGVRVAHAWNVESLYSYPSALPSPPVVSKVERRVGQELEEALRPWLRKFPRVPVERAVAMGGAAPFLLDASTGGSLLVVGRRLRGHPFPTRIGPVTHAALHHAQCPVAVVPHE